MSRHILERGREILNLPLHATDHANVFFFFFFFCLFLSLIAVETSMVSWSCLGEGSFWKPEAWGSLSLGQEALLRLWRSPELRASW